MMKQFIVKVMKEHKDLKNIYQMFVNKLFKRITQINKLIIIKHRLTKMTKLFQKELNKQIKFSFCMIQIKIENKQKLFADHSKINPLIGLMNYFIDLINIDLTNLPVNGNIVRQLCLMADIMERLLNKVI